MKRIRIIILLSFLFVFKANAQDERTKQVLSFLKEKKIEAQVLESGEIWFVEYNTDYVIRIPKKGEKFIEITCPSAYYITTEKEKKQAYEASSAVAQEYPLTKAYIKGEDFYISCELYVENFDNFKEYFDTVFKNILDASEYVLYSFH